MRLLIRWGALAASFWIATALIPGIDVLGGFTTYLWVALLFGLINSILGGLIKLLTGKKKINGIRIMLLGVIDGYRKMGIEACLYGRIIKAFKARNFQYAEASWTLEDNDMVNRPIENIGGKLYREYRILEKKI